MCSANFSIAETFPALASKDRFIAVGLFVIVELESPGIV